MKTNELQLRDRSKSVFDSSATVLAESFGVETARMGVGLGTVSLRSRARVDSPCEVEVRSVSEVHVLYAP